jgi:hypothetical protein
VPCGPRSTSTRSTSKKAAFAAADPVDLESDARLADRCQILEADAAQGDDRLLSHLADVQRRRVQRQGVDVGDAERVELRLVEGRDRLRLLLRARLERLADDGDLFDTFRRRGRGAGLRLEILCVGSGGALLRRRRGLLTGVGLLLVRRGGGVVRRRGLRAGSDAE